MLKFFEPSFHIIYLSSIFYMSFKMFFRSEDNKLLKLFGIMGLILGFGDSFHLIPRIYALLTNGLEANAVALGIGKMITSITMTIFYLILFRIWKLRFDIKNNRSINLFIGLLVLVRIVLIVMPQNRWTLYNPPTSWGIYRNIPFVILGALITYLILNSAIKEGDVQFKRIGFSIIMSFVCYIPVVLFANTFPLVGMMMIPKTIAYLWIVYIGYNNLKKKQYKNIVYNEKI